MKTKEEIIAALQELDGGDDYVAGLNGLVKDANKNSKAVKDLTKKVNDLTASNESLTGNYNKLSDFIGLPVETTDLDAALEEIKKQHDKDNRTSHSDCLICFLGNTKKRTDSKEL